MYRFRFLGKEKPMNAQCVSAIAQTVIGLETDFPRKAYCSLCTDTVSYGTDTVSYGTDTVSYGLFGKKGLPGLCSVLPPASNVGVLCCTATRTVLSALSHTQYNHKDHLQWATSDTPLICHCITRAVISLLPNILLCHSLLTLDIYLLCSSGCCH